MKIDRRKPRHWWLLFKQGLFALISAAVRLVRRRPPKPLIILYGHQLSGNLLALYEEWNRHYRKRIALSFLSLDPDYTNSLKNSGYEVLSCARFADMLKLSECHAIITDHGLHAMTPLVAISDIHFVDVWHGIPFKGFLPKDFRLQQKYDEIWVSSPLLKELYVEKLGFCAKKVLPLGYARTDKLFREDKPRDNIHQRLGLPATNKIVLYAPTWQQDSKGRELFPFGTSQEDFINTLAESCQLGGASLVIRSHLNAQIPDEPHPNVVYCSMRDYADTEELLLHTNLLITDWSSIAFDFLALVRPTIFVDVAPPFKHGFSLGAEYRFGAIARSFEDLQINLQTYLSTGCALENVERKQLENLSSELYKKNTKGKAAALQLERLLA